MKSITVTVAHEVPEDKFNAVRSFISDVNASEIEYQLETFDVKRGFSTMVFSNDENGCDADLGALGNRITKITGVTRRYEVKFYESGETGRIITDELHIFHDRHSFVDVLAKFTDKHFSYARRHARFENEAQITKGFGERVYGHVHRTGQFGGTDIITARAYVEINEIKAR